MDDDFDVAVIGYGPVGMATAALLGRLGHRVVVLERYSGKYNLPRAAIFDDETMRTFAMLGIAERMVPKVHVQRNYEWRNGAGELLIEHEFSEFGRSGWAEWYMMYQPDLEDALDDVCAQLPTVQVRFGARVTGVEQSAERVSISIENAAADVTARYAIACDGGNSFVRRCLGIPVRDYGFSEPWMVCDFRFTGTRSVPTARQVCDPAQPTSIISLGPDHHRFSFMLDSESAFETERQPDRVWARVANYLGRDEAELIRAATYTFRSLVAERWRDGRIILAGDAAHQMPPFLGQGMCSGVRDALNLSFKLDLIFNGAQPDALLDTYQSEREDHVRAVIQKGIELGRVQTMRDPVAAAARDAKLIAARRQRDAPEKFVFPPLGEGFWGGGAGSRDLIVQGNVTTVHGAGRFDEVFGYGPIVLVRAHLRPELDAVVAVAEQAGVRLGFIGDDAPARDDHSDAFIRDDDHTYGAWFDRHGCDAVAIRPDFHVWGTAVGAVGAATLTTQFAELLRPAPLSAHSERQESHAVV